ncbi:MAG: DNA polymerase III subunit gamma/tau, partial [Dehalococcoidia bacterium]|nr:DNA polymerase III subunit gamma/tau [Dehalococcoidia bacterium]
VNFVPNEARYKVYIIDEVHMLTHEAFNALLKTLEEPPSHAIFILATTEAHQVPSTIISRCQRFDFRRIPVPQMVERLAHICREEGVAAQPDVLELLARRAAGSLRDAENMLDQLVANYGTEINFAQVQELLGLTSDQKVQDLARLILKKDIPAGLAAINGISEEGADLRQFSRQLVEHLRQLLLIKMNAPAANLTAETHEELASTVQNVETQELVKAIKLFAQADMRLEVPAALPLELALVEYAISREEASPRTAAAIPAKAPEVREASPRPIAAPRPQAAAPSSLAPPPGDPLEHLSANWPRILAEVRQTNKSIEALLRGSCKVVAVEDGSVTLGFFWEMHKLKLEEVKTRRIVEEIFSRVLGRACQIKCILTPKESGASPVSPPFTEVKGQPAAPANSDPLVDMAVREYGARVVGQTKQPAASPADSTEMPDAS